MIITLDMLGVMTPSLFQIASDTLSEAIQDSYGVITPSRSRVMIVYDSNVSFEHKYLYHMLNHKRS